MTGVAAHAVGPALAVRPWHRDRRVAYLAPSGVGRLTPTTVSETVAPLADRGFRSAMTPALDATQQIPFLAADFTVVETLHLLEHRLDDIPEVDTPSAPRVRRCRRRDLDDVVAADLGAFGPTFWHLGRDGLIETLRATPFTRFRVVGDTERVSAYAIWGRAGRTGYLQRLAVHPDEQRRGLARALVADGLEWLRRRRCRSGLVNTQPGNAAALALYASLGFERHRTGLAVLGLDLTGLTKAAEAMP